MIGSFVLRWPLISTAIFTGCLWLALVLVMLLWEVHLLLGVLAILVFVLSFYLFLIFVIKSAMKAAHYS